MFNKILLIILAVVLLFVFTLPVLAQEPTAELTEPLPTFDWPTQLPATAQEALEVIGAFLVFVSSLATIYVTRWLRKLPLLNETEKSKIIGWGADAVAGVIGFAAYVILVYGAYLAGFLDQNGMWSVLRWVFAVWPTTWTMHKGLKLSRAVGSK